MTRDLLPFAFVHARRETDAQTVQELLVSRLRVEALDLPVRVVAVEPQEYLALVIAHCIQLTAHRRVEA